MDVRISTFLHRSFKHSTPILFLNKLFPLWVILFLTMNPTRWMDIVGLLTIPMATKILMERQRPYISHPHLFQSINGTRYMGLDRYSFPSGHATFYSFFCFYYMLSWPIWILFMIHSLARPCVGVHWFSDVVGGWVQGWIMAALFNMPVYPLLHCIGTIVAVSGWLWFDCRPFLFSPPFLPIAFSKLGRTCIDLPQSA